MTTSPSFCGKEQQIISKFKKGLVNTYVDCLSNNLTVDIVLPSLKELLKSSLGRVHEHSPQELSLEVSLHGASLHVVQSQGLALSYQTIEDLANPVCTKARVVSVTSLAGSCDLLPFLESLCQIEIHHSVGHPHHHHVSLLLLS